MQKFRVGIVGAGYVSAHHLRALAAVEAAEVVGICDVDFARAQAVAATFRLPAAYAGMDALLTAGVDVVHILTPPASHAALATQALRAGVHVLVEKPMAETVEQCEQMMAAATASGKQLCVVHSARLDPVVQRGVELVRKGEIGEIVSLDFQRTSDYPAWPGGKLPPQYRKGSYPFQDLGVHGLAIAEAFLGEIESAQVDFRSTGRDTNLQFDEWTATVQCRRGPARLYFSWNVRPIRSQVTVHGTRGVMQIDCFLQTCYVTRLLPGPKFASPVICAMRNAAVSLFEVPANVLRFMTRRLPGAPGIQANIRAFYAALAAGGPMPVPAEEGLRLVRVMAPASVEADRLRELARQEQLAPRSPAQALVTGAGGFLGSALVRRLAADGVAVRAAVRRIPPQPVPGVDYVTGDLGDSEYVDSIVSGIETVYHVGATMKGAAADFQRGTVTATRNMIDACLRQPVRRFVYVSSLSVLEHAVARPPSPANLVTEAWPLEPWPQLRGAYTQTKLEAERMVLAAARERGLPAVILRPGVIFGPGAEPSSPAGSFGMFGRWIVVGDGSLPLPLVYVDDVVQAMVLAATQPLAPGALVNLVDPATIGQRDFIAIVQAAKPGVKATYAPKPVLMTLALGVETLGRLLKRNVPLSRYRIASIRPLAWFDQTAARQQLGWTPQVGLQEGLRRTFGLSSASRVEEPIAR